MYVLYVFALERVDPHLCWGAKTLL